MKDIKLDNAKKLAAKLKATSGTFLANNDDILRRMLSFFSMKRLCRLETISKRFRSVINDPIVWKSLCTTRFKIKCNHDALYVHDWKKLCIARQHRRRKSIWICPYCDCTFTASSSNSLQVMSIIYILRNMLCYRSTCMFIESHRVNVRTNKQSHIHRKT